MGRVTPAWQLGQCLGTAGGDSRRGMLREAASASDEMGQASWPLRPPGLLDAVPSAAQDALPVVDEGEERLFGAARVDAIEGDRCRGHAPKPLQRPMAKPGGCIDVMGRGLASDVGHGLLGGWEHQGDAVADWLAGSQAEGAPEY
jgi:hypothetical protein